MIYRAHGLRVIIFTDDHEPAHVHVFGDGQAKINLIGPDGSPALVSAEDMKANDLRRAVGPRPAGAVSCQMEGNPWLT